MIFGNIGAFSGNGANQPYWHCAAAYLVCAKCEWCNVVQLGAKEYKRVRSSANSTSRCHDV